MESVFYQMFKPQLIRKKIVSSTIQTSISKKPLGICNRGSQQLLLLALLLVEVIENVKAVGR
jgi:hypothetical protein